MDDWSLPQKLIDKLFSPDSDIRIQDFHDHLQQLKNSVRTDPAPNAYSRKVLFQDQRGEILMMRWAKDVFCYPHDHAIAAGYVVLLEGEFVERDYDFDGGLVRKGSRNAMSPSIFPFEKSRIHDMKCLDEGYSLHVYMPAISGMKVYDIEGRKTLSVDDSCGAWIPSDKGKILDVQDWSSLVAKVP